MSIKFSIASKPKAKSALAAHSKTHKKKLEHQTSLVAIASSVGDELLPPLKLEQREIKDLNGAKRRVRKSEAAQVERVAKSLRTFGQCAPIIISGDGEIIDGHIVVQALRSLGATQVNCVMVSHLDEQQRNLLHITLNRVAECGDWDVEGLGDLLCDLKEFDFELGVTGFTLPELDIIMTSPVEPPANGEGQGSEEDLTATGPAVSVQGDLWQLGPHRLFCGDATDPASFQAVLQGGRADMVFTDLPWNIPIAGFVSGLGKTKHQDFAMGAGEMSPEDFVEFCNLAHARCAEHLKGGGVLFSCIDWRSVDVITAAGKNAGLRHFNTIVWNKGSGGMGAPYRSAHELIVAFSKGDKLAVNNIQLGKHGRDRTNVWTYPGANRRGSSAGKALEHHPTPKPVEMVEDAIKDLTTAKALVLDPFLGSGTTLLAAHRAGRVACGIELDPKYVDVAIRRWQDMVGKAAVHVQTGLAFSALLEVRSAGGDDVDGAE